MMISIGGGFTRALGGLIAAAPTLAVGLFIAAVLRYYLGTAGTKRLFGNDSLWALPQSWLVGMLLPVCSIGVIPILREMRRLGIRPGAITAFALSAPLFNPLSLLYGLTLSRPSVIIGFAAGSLAVVTLLGLIWDRYAAEPTSSTTGGAGQPIGLRRIAACALFMGRELCGPSGWLALAAVAGLLLLGGILPHGALQSSVEQTNPWAPAVMSLVAVPIYATPMLTMSQLGMMFAHGNSPGAAFVLLLLGTGVNLGTLWWVSANFGWRSTLVWFSVLFAIILGIAYAVDKPLIPPGVEPAGHTHAFDIYTNPFHSGTALTLSMLWDALSDNVGIFDYVNLGLLGLLLLVGGAARKFSAEGDLDMDHCEEDSVAQLPEKGWNRRVSSRTVGLTCLAGLVAFSIVGCYAYYPAASEVLEEMRLARVEVLVGLTSRDYERTLLWIPVLEEWSRKLEVGHALRKFELRPYQRMQAYLLRKKLELLEHEIEGLELKQELDPVHQRELEELQRGIRETSQRLVHVFS